MAAGTLPKPGTKLGPCKSKRDGVVKGCSHRDCLTTRRMAEEVCRFCGDMIGYDRRFYTDPQNTRAVRGDSELSGPSLVHADCLEDYYDKEPM